MPEERALFGGPELHSLAAQYGANEGPLPIILDLLECKYEKSGSAIRQTKLEHTLSVSPKPVRTNKN
ncbi:hypothetical protein [Ahrensia marina]|uniref:Uncharacterized protein n=1 Tax=Ahrensia marina TaxID=1514904 RepID=A0A0M9GPH8_9HYPH|nr:hypothetical protein [Ahrensia marina]KPB02633.1 hypothetical protein SU32_02520 [Ahrensia marina]